MNSYSISESNPLPPVVLQQIMVSGLLDEISNSSGSVRHHVFWFGDRDKVSGKLRRPMLFSVYQNTRHGPQNGFRLCLFHEGYYIASDTKVDGAAEDDIDRLEKSIPQGSMEFVVLGVPPSTPAENTEGDE